MVTTAHALPIATRAEAIDWNNLGDRHFAAGNFREAAGHYEQALRLNQDFAEAHNDLGIALQHLGEWRKAENCHREALRLIPHFAAAYNNLGSALRGQGQWTDAVAAFERALRLEPKQPELAFNLGTTLYELGELDRAVAYYRQALRLKPDYEAALSNLATALIEQGLLEEGSAQFRESLKLRPDQAIIYYFLSELAAEGRCRLTPAELDRIKAIMSSGRCSAAERSLCCFALAKTLDKQGSYDEAFAYYKQANDLRKHLLEQRHAAFDAQSHEALVGRIIAAYDQAYFERSEGWGTDTSLPVFIIGMPRSGTTLVEQILASHPQVFGAGEIGEIPQFMTQPNLDSPFLPDRGAARKLAEDYVRWIAKLGKGAARVSIKTPQNFLHLGLIATLFPRARIIHCRRDPLDICLSCYFTNFQNVDFAWSLEDIGAYYRAYEKLMAHWSRVLPVQIHEVRYEELIQNQDTVTRDLLSFCGLDWDERCLTFYNTRRAVRTASTVQVRKPISAQAIGRWQHYRSHLGPLFQALGRHLEQETETLQAFPSASQVTLHDLGAGRIMSP